MFYLLDNSYNIYTYSNYNTFPPLSYVVYIIKNILGNNNMIIQRLNLVFNWIFLGLKYWTNLILFTVMCSLPPSHVCRAGVSSNYKMQVFMITRVAFSASKSAQENCIFHAMSSSMCM